MEELREENLEIHYILADRVRVIILQEVVLEIIKMVIVAVVQEMVVMVIIQLLLTHHSVEVEEVEGVIQLVVLVEVQVVKEV